MVGQIPMLGYPLLWRCLVRRDHGRLDKIDKGSRWMSWHQEAMKDVGTCEKLREAGNRAMILRSPNGETLSSLLDNPCLNA
jgi:hypothetical protein